MRLIIVSLFLTLAVFFNSIELSSQSSRSEGSQRPGGRRRPLRMELPFPYYYDASANGEIRERGRPNARPILGGDNNLFLGMYEGSHFSPIIIGGKQFTIDLNAKRSQEINGHERSLLNIQVQNYLRSLGHGTSSS